MSVGLVLLLASIGYVMGALRLWQALRVDGYRVGPEGLTLRRSPLPSLRRSVALAPRQVRDIRARRWEFTGSRGRSTRWLVEAVPHSGIPVELGRFFEEAEAEWLARTLRHALGPPRASRGVKVPTPAA